MNRCLNDMFGYCKGESETTTVLEPKQYQNVTGKFFPVTEAITTCKRDNRKCGNFISHLELYGKEVSHGPSKPTRKRPTVKNA